MEKAALSVVIVLRKIRTTESGLLMKQHRLSLDHRENGAVRGNSPDREQDHKEQPAHGSIHTRYRKMLL